jgi:hypothetical protein
VNRDQERIYDEYLVAAAITRDQPALSRLVARWHPKLLRHAWRVLGDSERAKDVVQEAWIEILRSVAGLHDVAAFPAPQCAAPKEPWVRSKMVLRIQGAARKRRVPLCVMSVFG